VVMSQSPAYVILLPLPSSRMVIHRSLTTAAILATLILCLEILVKLRRHSAIQMISSFPNLLLIFGRPLLEPSTLTHRSCFSLPEVTLIPLSLSLNGANGMKLPHLPLLHLDCWIFHLKVALGLRLLNAISWAFH